MYLQDIPDNVKTTTLLKIKYDCCNKDHILKFKDADKNFKKNGGKHICRPCWLKDNNPGSQPEVRKKMKKTCLERYGTECPLNTAENIDARVEQMFGTESAVQKIVAKRKKTSQEKYGTDHPMQNNEIKAKQQAVLEEKYGVSVPLQNDKIKAKMQKTVLEKYGVTNVALLPEVRAKMAKTMYERYGVEHYNELPEMKDYLREHCAEWLKESWEAGGPMKGIVRPEEWNEKQRKTVTDLIILGVWKAGYPRSKKGFCFTRNKCKKSKVYFRSSYEAIYCFYLDNHPDVEWFSFEAFRIQYEYDGRQRYYIPDFVIKWVGKSKLAIHELKAEFMKDDEQVEVKSRCANLFADNNSMEFNMLCCKEIQDLGISFDKLKETGFVE